MMQPYYQDDLVTIYHGDCREVLWLSIEADVLVTDPPYGMKYGGWNNRRQAVIGDESTSSRDSVLAVWPGPALVFGTWRAPRPADTRLVLIWDKGRPGMGDIPRGDGRSGPRLGLPWGPSHEEIYVIGEGFAGSPRMGTVLRFDVVRGPHPTIKPVALMAHLLERCPPGVVLDPFMGSGSTLVAAAALGRKAIGIEIEERYCEIAANRCRQEVLGLSA
jgi:DNA modification methylase